MKRWVPILLASGLVLVWISASAQGFLRGHIIRGGSPDAVAERYVESRKQLDASYEALFRQLDPVGQRKLQTAQTAWRNYSLAECDFKVHRSAIEPLHPMTFNVCMIGMNVDRMEDLDQELQWHRLLAPGS